MRVYCLPYRHSREGHEVEETVHSQAPKETNAIYIVEIKLAREHDEGSKGNGKDDWSC